MKVIASINEMREHRNEIGDDKKLGLVPTLGGLHSGHESLMRQCRKEYDVMAVTIYLNSAQFAPGEDLDRYPAKMEADLLFCKELGADIVFTPNESDMYPATHSSWCRTAVGEASRNPNSEGANRPTFFRGVATVLCKLLSVVRPDAMYAGQKDAQQCAVMRVLLGQLWPKIELKVMQIVREDDGLAVSTRNRYLNAAERAYAPVLYEALQVGLKAFKSDGVRDANEIRGLVRRHVEVTHPPGEEVIFEFLYVSVCNRVDLREVDAIIPERDSRETLICVAARMGDSRLIDNVVLGD